MKALESFSVSESFGLKDLSLEEIENINGGVSIGTCGKFSDPNTGRLSGAVMGPTNPSVPGPITGVSTISIGSGNGTSGASSGGSGK